MTSPLLNQFAVVTGAGSGIGRATALELACHRVHLCLVGRTSEKLGATHQHASRLGVDVVSLVADVSRPRDVARVVARVRSEFGGLNMLVHSAGTIATGPLAKASLDSFQEQLTTNVLGPYLLTQQLHPLLRKNHGQVAFINSSIVCHSRAGVAQFAATQHALKGLADCLRHELNDEGIRIISVFPGRTATPRQQRLHRAANKPYHPERLLQPEDVARLISHAFSLPRTAEVTDIHVRPMMKE